MNYVVLDTDVASLLIKNRLPPPLLAKLASLRPCVTFVTIGEMTEWAEVRHWGGKTVRSVEAWLSSVVHLEYDDEVARVWGRLSAAARRNGRPRPINDMWNAACCLVEQLPLATLNVKDYIDFVDSAGLQVITA